MLETDKNTFPACDVNVQKFNPWAPGKLGVVWRLLLMRTYSVVAQLNEKNKRKCSCIRSRRKSKCFFSIVSNLVLLVRYTKLHISNCFFVFEIKTVVIFINYVSHAISLVVYCALGLKSFFSKWNANEDCFILSFVYYQSAF